MYSLISAITIIALISGQAESIKFGTKTAPALALPALPEPAPQYLAPVAAPPAPLPVASPAITTTTREISYGIKGAAPLPLPAPLPAAPILTQQLEPARYLPAQPLTYIYLKPLPQQYSYHVRYAEAPRQLLAPEYVNREVYRELAPLPAPVHYAQAPLVAPAPIALPLPAPAIIRETSLDAPDLGAIKAGKLSKLKGSIERALGLLSFGSYHVAKEEQFLPPPPVSYLQPAIIEQQREQHHQIVQTQEQENIRDIEQHQEQVRESTKQADQQLPLQQQSLNEVRESSYRNVQQNQVSNSDVDQSGFKRSSSL